MAVFAAWRTELPAVTIPAASFLGDISYALYLTHPFTNIVANVTARVLNLGKPATFALFIVAAIGISAAVFWWFEVPARDWLRGRRRLFSRLATLP